MPNFIINVKEKGAKKADKNIKGLNKSLGSLKNSAMAAAGAFLGAGALVAGIKRATDAFGEQELAEKKLEASLGRTSQALLEQAAALQQVSNFGDETIISAQALIAAFVDDEEQIKKATQATLDLAAAKGMDLNAAADLVSKTLGSSTNAMSRYGIEVQGAVGSTERLDSLTGNIAEKFGGQAKAQSETLTGSIKGMSDAIGDAAENLGELLAPAVGKIATAFKSASENATEFLKSLSNETEEAEKNTLTTERNAAVTNLFGQAIGFIGQKMVDFGVTGGLRNALLEEQAKQEKEYSESLLGQANNLQEIEKAELRRTETSLNFESQIKKVRETNKTLYSEEANLKKQQLQDDLKAAALSGQSASESMKSVVRAKFMESVAKQISNIMGIVPFPFNFGVAAGAGTLMSGAFDKAMSAIPSFATGGDFTTNGEQLIRVGDNASGRERVQVTPLDAGGEPTGGGGAVNITFNSPIMSSDYTEDVIIPQIKEALRRGASL